MRNKNNIRKGKKGYEGWLAERDGYDPKGLEDVWDGNSPWATSSMSPVLDDAYEKLEELYYDKKLKGRQRQIVSLLMDGVFNQRKIASKLGIDFREVSTHLKRIRNKLIKYV